MKILLYHPVKLPVLHYGGTERVAMWLVNTLHQLGHSVAVFAAPGSSMPEGIECLTDPAELSKRASEFDIVHAFTKPSEAFYREFNHKVLVTIHGNGQPGEKFHRNTVFLSRDHAKRHGATEFVYNGLDPTELQFNDQPRANRFLFLSKTSWRVKNLRGAVRYASRANQNLWIAGGTRPYYLRLVTWIKSLLGKDWKWVGSVSQADKAKFLVSGKAMVFPQLWSEPFGLVMIEALASGTPVFANAQGSVPEILEFAPQCLMRSEEDWMRAMRGEMKTPSAQECRDWVLNNFDQTIMTKKYLELYERIAKGEILHRDEPQTR